MTRRRAFALIFGVLIAVFASGSIITITAVRAQLVDEVDESLEAAVDGLVLIFDELPASDLERLDAPVNERALYRISPLGAIEFVVPAGSLVDPIPLPDVPPSRVIARVDETFAADGMNGGPNYRVASRQLTNGDFVALAQPLDNVRSTLGALARILLGTLFAMVVVLGAIFWWLLRQSLRPYEDMIDTAQAIAGGDLDRRTTSDAAPPEIAQLQDSLNTMLDAIQESLLAREAAENSVKQFAADASHELRTPLTTIAGYSELYLSGAATDSESVDKQMRRINSEAGRMARLVNDLLILARLDQGTSVKSRPVDLAEVIGDVVDDRRAVDAGLSIEVAIDTCSDLTVMADRDSLHQVFVNLLANSATHAPGASVTIRLTTDGDHAVVAVADDGPGMDAETASLAFDRFFRADTARSSRSQSTGLGLSIVATVVESLRGSVHVETSPGAGATFVVRLPLQSH